MAGYKVLLSGESWVFTSSYIKGFDMFATATCHTGADKLLAALKVDLLDVNFMRAHEAQSAFPQSPVTMPEYDAIVLSDIGANTLFLHPATWIKWRPTPNRLRLLRDYAH